MSKNSTSAFHKLLALDDAGLLSNLFICHLQDIQAYPYLPYSPEWVVVPSSHPGYTSCLPLLCQSGPAYMPLSVTQLFAVWCWRVCGKMASANTGTTGKVFWVPIPSLNFLVYKDWMFIQNDELTAVSKANILWCKPLSTCWTLKRSKIIIIYLVI